ncbi:MAG TPA: hypothetical protein VGI40_18035 [Pirellulaceae bacterium]
MARRKKRRPRFGKDGFMLPGDTSLDAVAKRLIEIRECVSASQIGRERITNVARCTAAEWRRWQSGKELIPRRNAWFISTYTIDNYCDYSYSVEWIFTGKWTERTITSAPKLGDNLSAFAARVRQAREAFGITLDDVKSVCANGMILFAQWKSFEAGVDEPAFDQLQTLIDRLEVDVDWLYRIDKASQGQRSAMPKWPGGLKPLFDKSWDVGSGPEYMARIESALAKAGISKSDSKQLFKDFGDAGEATAVAFLCGVPLESLIFDAAELTILRRRIDRFKRRFGISPPRNRRASAA